MHRGYNGRSSRRDDDIDLAPGKLGRDLRKPLLASLGPAVLDRDTTTVDPTKFAQSPHKLGHPFASGRTRVRAQEPDGRHLRWLLRARNERPRRRSTEQRDEVAAPQVGESHSVSSQPEPNCRISNWRGPVSGVYTPVHAWT